MGEAIEVVDGEGRRARGVIVGIGEAETVIEVGEPERVGAAGPLVRVLVPLIKGERMDLCLEKLVEAGADEIVIWPAARSVVKLPAERRDARVAHYQAQVVAAARQSGRAAVPTVALAESLGAAIAALPARADDGAEAGEGGDGAARAARAARVVLDPGADRAPPPTADDVTLVSGPEGGLAPAELDALAAAGFAHLGLGPRTLRAETAPVIAVALVRAATGS